VSFILLPLTSHVLLRSRNSTAVYRRRRRRREMEKDGTGRVGVVESRTVGVVRPTPIPCRIVLHRESAPAPANAVCAGSSGSSNISRSVGRPDNPAGFVAAGRVDLACDCGLLSSGSNLAPYSGRCIVLRASFAVPFPAPPLLPRSPACCMMAWHNLFLGGEPRNMSVDNAWIGSGS